jgi:hypothetical protein
VVAVVVEMTTEEALAALEVVEVELQTHLLMELRVLPTQEAAVVEEETNLEAQVVQES